MLRVRWLGRVPFEEAHALQRALWSEGTDDYLLLLEHPHVYTLGVRADPAHVLVDPATVGAALVRTDRGGDVTYHGPGQLVGYPIVTLVDAACGMANTPAYVHDVEQVVIDALGDVGLSDVGRLARYPGVWVGSSGDSPRKIAAIGVRLSRGRSMHGFAINVDPDLAMFSHIVPCGIAEFGVTSLAAQGIGATMQEVAEAVASHASLRWGGGERETTAVSEAVHGRRAAGLGPESPGLRLLGRWADAGVDAAQAVTLSVRKPSWLRAKANMGPQYRSLQQQMRSLELVTVCEEAGCPNIFECWADGTATFMINGERCTRSCGFCLVDTSHPLPPDLDEPERVATAVERLGLQHAVVTAVARDDLSDGGAAAFAATIAAIRRQTPGVAVETLIPDFKGDHESLQLVIDARPDVLNHNVETVARLQRVVRPSAGYARSLAVLARCAEAGLPTKSGLILGMGERDDEVVSTMADLRNVGVRIVTIGQYLRPSARHLPVHRFVEPDVFDRLRAAGERMGFDHVEASPMTRSSYHAKRAAAASLAGSSSL